MSIVATDLIFYSCASQSEDNVSTEGGAIDLTTYVVFSDSSLANALNDSVEIVSSNAGDTTQTVTIYGRSSSGIVVSEPLSLNGTIVVNGSQVFERILKIVVSASHAGTITIRKATGDTTIASLPTGILKIKRCFISAASDVSTGSSRDFYEKVFLKNTHATLALLGATIAEQADPSTLLTFNVDNAVNSTTSIASRLNTVPANQQGSFDGTTKNVASTDLAAGAAQGIWLKLTLPAGQAATVSTYTLRVSGTSI